MAIRECLRSRACRANRCPSNRARRLAWRRREHRPRRRSRPRLTARPTPAATCARNSTVAGFGARIAAARCRCRPCLLHHRSPPCPRRARSRRACGVRTLTTSVQLIGAHSSGARPCASERHLQACREKELGPATPVTTCVPSLAFHRNERQARARLQARAHRPTDAEPEQSARCQREAPLAFRDGSVLGCSIERHAQRPSAETEVEREVRRFEQGTRPTSEPSNAEVAMVPCGARSSSAFLPPNVTSSSNGPRRGWSPRRRHRSASDPR